MFDHLEYIPLDPIFRLLNAYNDDERSFKVNLGIGYYFDTEGGPFVFESVKKAFRKINVNDFYYEPIRGNSEYLALCANLIFGEGRKDLALQMACGGTQACSLYAGLLEREGAGRTVWIAEPTWSNHFVIFRESPIEKFSHLGADGKVDFEGYRGAALRAAPGDIFVLHGGLSHNPSGRNLSMDQLAELVSIFHEKRMGVFVDFAYAGLGEGLEKDCEYVRFLFDNLENVACGISFSKNASMYEHRAGALIVKCKNEEILRLESQMQSLMREVISMAPGAGQEAMIDVLSENFSEWKSELEQARLDVENRKTLLINKIVELGGETFSSLLECRGMFALLPLTLEQLDKLRLDYAIYLPSNGRINFAGIRLADIDYIAKSIVSVL